MRIKLALFFVFTTILSNLTSCSKEPSKPDCETNNYGIFEIKNDFTESVTLKIDGALKGTIKVGETKKFTLQAGTSYNIYVEESEYFLFPDDTWQFTVTMLQCKTVSRRLIP